MRPPLCNPTVGHKCIPCSVILLWNGHISLDCPVIVKHSLKQRGVSRFSRAFRLVKLGLCAEILQSAQHLQVILAFCGALGQKSFWYAVLAAS